jgi:hypothetical protein
VRWHWVAATVDAARPARAGRAGLDPKDCDGASLRHATRAECRAHAAANDVYVLDTRGHGACRAWRSFAIRSNASPELVLFVLAAMC